MGELRSYSTRARITADELRKRLLVGQLQGQRGCVDGEVLRRVTSTSPIGAPTSSSCGCLRASWTRRQRARTAPASAPPCVRRMERSSSLSCPRTRREGDWVEDDGQLSSLISIRSELARGDLRALYLGWLLCAQSGDLDDDELEPPVPAGLGQLSASLESFVEFLRIDFDLIDAAAAASPPLADMEPKPAEVRHGSRSSPRPTRTTFSRG